MAKDICDVPPEVLDLTLDFLHDDSASLRAASLVSRQWVHESRHHLFNKVTLKDLSMPAPGLNLKNAQTFLELAQSTHCTFLPAIRSATFLVNDAQLMEDIVDILARSSPINHVVVRNSMNQQTKWKLSSFPQIRDFTYNSSAEAGENPWALLQSCSQLRAFALHTHSSTVLALPTDVSGLRFNSLRTLRLHLSNSEELFTWMTNLKETHFAIETLDLQLIRSCHNGWGPVAGLNTFLKRTATTLQQLTIRMEYDNGLKEDMSSAAEIIDLSPLVNLRSLWLRTHDVNAACSSVSTLASPYLHDIAIHALYWPWECSCNHTAHFPRLAEIMNNDQFNNVASLDVSVPWGTNLTTVKEQFATWKNAHLLTVALTTYDVAQPNGFNSFWDLMRASGKI